MQVTNIMQPDRIKIGGGLILVSLEGLAKDWGITVKAVEKLLGALKIPTIKMPDHPVRYISLFSLENELFTLALPEALRNQKELARLNLELAGVLYGTLTKEVIRERVKGLAKTLKQGLTSYDKKTRIKRR